MKGWAWRFGDLEIGVWSMEYGVWTMEYGLWSMEIEDWWMEIGGWRMVDAHQLISLKTHQLSDTYPYLKQGEHLILFSVTTAMALISLIGGYYDQSYGRRLRCIKQVKTNHQPYAKRSS